MEKEKMRQIKTSQMKDKVKEPLLKANCHIDQALIQRLAGALEDETSLIGKSVLQMNIEINKISSSEEIAICQDTGLAVLFKNLAGVDAFPICLATKDQNKIVEAVTFDPNVVERGSEAVVKAAIESGVARG